MFKRLRLIRLTTFCLNYVTKVEIDPSLKESFEKNIFKPRKHPGTIRLKTAAIPPDIQKAIKIVINDNDGKSMREEAVKLRNYLFSRHLPPEDNDITIKAAKIHESVTKQAYKKLKQNATPEEAEKIERVLENKVFNLLKKNVYRWGSINYDKATSMQYLLARAAPDYAVLIRIFDEIARLFPDYKPRSFFDFGSGIGTGTWAANHFWKDHIYEYYCVDSSPDMHDLARLILCRGRDNVQIPFKAYYQRQFLPASSDLKYSIVLSAYSLFELPDMKSRIETIQKLWNKTEDYLIIVEQGTNAGFQVVNEAREFVLNHSKNDNIGHAFAPCPHDSVCPRYLEKETPCNFIMKYESMSAKNEINADLFTYIILKKGPRPADDPQWPRIVRSPLVRSKHTICRLCTSQGDLKEIIFSKAKYDQSTYRCARSSNWGDLLPVK